MRISFAPMAIMVAAEAHCSGMRLTRLWQWLRIRLIMRRASLPELPSLFDEQVNGVVLIDVLEDAVKGQHVVAADAAAIAVPIAKQRAVEVVFKFGEDFLCFGKQSRRLFDRYFVFVHGVLPL